MKTHFIRLIFIFLVLMGCLQQLIAADAEVKTVRVGFFQFDGYQETDADGVHSGYGYDLLGLVQRYANVNFEYVGCQNSLSECLQMLRDGEIDLLTSSPRSAERMSEFDFTLPVGETSVMLNVRASDSRYFPYDFEHFGHLEIGMFEYSNLPIQLEKFAAENGFTYTSHYYRTIRQLEQALKNKEVDAIATSSLRRMHDEKTIAKFNNQYFHMIVKKGNRQLVDLLDYAISQMNSNEGDWQHTLYHKNYITTQSNQISFTQQEKDYILKHSDYRSPVVVVFDNVWKPFSSKEDGSYEGIIPDYWDRIMKITGMTSRCYDAGSPYVNLQILNEGKADIYLGISESFAATEKEGLLLSPVFMNVGASFLYRKSNPNIQKIGLCHNTPVLNLQFPPDEGRELHYYADTDEGYRALKRGEVDVVVCYTLDAERLVLNDLDGSVSYRILSGLNLDLMAAISAKADHTLLSIVSKCINHMKGAETEVIVQNNLSFTNTDFRLRDWMMRHPYATGCIVLLVLIVLGIILIMGIRLRIRRAVDAEQRRQLKNSADFATAISHDALDIFELDLNNRTSITIKAQGRMVPVKERVVRDYEETWQNYIDRFVHPDDSDRMRSFVNIDNIKALLDENDETSCRFRINYKGATLYYCIYFSYLGKKEQGKVLFWFRCVDDIVRHEQEQMAEMDQLNENLKEALRKAEAANKAKSSFLFNMSHDIRTPMNAIIGFANLIKQHYDESSRVRDYIEKVSFSSEYLLSLINNVLEMARIDSGKVQMEETVLYTPDNPKRIAAVWDEQMASKNITFTQNFNITTPYICLDVTKLNQVFLNLISNAYKYTDEGGTITVDYQEIPSDRPGYIMVRTTITDNGRGMSPEYLETIFDEFSRENISSGNIIQGTGLGMSIVKKLVTLLDGTIEVESELGKGTKFIVTMPHRIASGADKRNAEPAALNMQVFKDKRILLAEDNDLNAEIAIEILQAAGFKVQRAADGAICLDMLSKASSDYYDLILMDIQMPNMDGYEATAHIRMMDDPYKSRIPIFAMTANAFEEDKRNAINAGMNGHIAKPINVQLLLKTLAETLMK